MGKKRKWRPSVRRGALSFRLGAALQATGQGNRNVQLAPLRRAAAAQGLRPQADLVSLCPRRS